MKKTKWILFLIIIFSGLFSSSFSQKIERNLIIKYTNDLGLASNYVYQIIQDNKGFIWIGTEEGLNKFDGKNFTEFSTKAGRYKMSHNRAQTLMLAPDGNVWAGTSDGINIYDYKTDSIIEVKTTTSPLKLKYNDITVLTPGRNKKITWIGTYGDGVHFFNWDNKKFAKLALPKLHGVNAPLQVMSILEDDSKRLWIGTQNNGLYKYDLTRKNLEHCPLLEPNLNIQTIYQDSYRRLWVGTNKGCYILNETTERMEQVSYPESVRKNSINVIREDHQGRLWLGADLFLLNFSSRSFSKSEKFDYQTFTHGESNFTLNCPYISSIFADRDNNIWISTIWGGVNMMQGVQSKFKLYKQEADKPYSLPRTPVSGICGDTKGNLLLSTNTKGVYMLNPANDEFRKVKTAQDYTGYDFQTILYDNEGRMWLGTFKNGLIVLDKNGVEKINFKKNTIVSNSLPNNDVRCLYQCKNNTIWVGTQQGIAVVNPQSLKIDTVIHLYNNPGVRVIKEDNEGLIWIGTYGRGVVTFNPSTKVLNYEPTPFNLNIVYDIFINQNDVWIATHGDGVFFYAKDTQAKFTYSVDVGMPTNFIRSILMDKSGLVWAGTSKGISKINPQTREIQNFNSQDGLQAQGFYERSTYMSPLGDGLMYFGGYFGLNVFNPKDVTKNDHCPPVIFTKLSVSNQLVAPSEGKKNATLTENINIADKIVLDYDQSVFSVDFVGLDYNASAKIQYAYRLIGSDTNWNNLGLQNNITFRNLRPGKFLLQVKASSPDGVWSDKNIASIRIIQKPPFWETWWAYMIYLMLFASIVYFVLQFATLKIRTQNELNIERAKLEKEEELHQEKLQFFTNISHEFRTPLTLLIGPLEKLHRDESNEAKKSSIWLMLRNAKRLLVMVNQLLDFRKSERGQMMLNVKYADLIPFVNEIMRSYEELKVTKHIAFEFVHPDAALMAWFDPEFLDKCLFNLISNAFKFTPENGAIKVVVAKIDESIEISVVDNGPGILANDLNKIFKRFFSGSEHSALQPGTGIGLHLTKNLIELHHGTIAVRSIQNEETVFTLSFPANQNAYSGAEFAVGTAAHSTQTDDDPMKNIDLPDEKEPRSRKKKKILLVEDNVEIRLYVKESLLPNYLVDEAENGAIGLKMVADNEYNLIISDVMMPVMDGMEMCRQLKASVETDYIPIIMLTAKSSIDSKIEGLNTGADSYIVKPFHPDHLLTRVNKLIEQRELLKERYSRKILIDNFQNPEKKPEVSPDELFLQRIIAIVLNRMVEPGFNGDVLAAELNISRMGLHRKIKALTGQSTGEFIRNVRLKKACELLTDSGKNVSEVSYDVGFSSPSYFTSCFTEVYHMPPSEYVRSRKKSESGFI